MLNQDVAKKWIARWDLQQEGYLPDREERFTALIDAVEALGKPDPLVLDLGCGPGSLSARLLERLPKAEVVAIDADPLLLGLGRAAYPTLTFASVDLRQPGWTKTLGLKRSVDAAVSTTALHWITGAELETVYAEVASVLRPGGLLLNGDHLDGDFPMLSTLEKAVHERRPSAGSRRIVRRAGVPGGTPSPPTRTWPPSTQSAPRLDPRTTAPSPTCSRPTRAPCARPASARSAHSGSAATTACSARSPSPWTWDSSATSRPMNPRRSSQPTPGPYPNPGL